VAAIDGGTLVADNALTQSLRLRQLASAYGEMVVGAEDQPDYERSVKLSEPSSKLDELELVLEELGERQAVIFAESRQLIELAAARLEGKSFGMVTGAIDAEQRAADVERFQKGELQYMLCTVGAGGEGITLTAADVCIFLQRPWSAVLNAQAEDRLHRVGQTGQSVTYIDLVANVEIEERVYETLRRKADQLQNVVRDTEVAHV
jgi:SNF2 family DNA or RNA helicase